MSGACSDGGWSIPSASIEGVRRSSARTANAFSSDCCFSAGGRLDTVVERRQLSVTRGAAAASSPTGMVAAAHPVAAAAGAEILAAGGNAVDAAVATSATLGVVEPFASGIGGGGFLLSYRADTNQVTALDCRETAPAAVTPDALIDTATGKPYADNTLLSGGLGVGVPGQVECWSEAVRRFGRLSLMQDLQPAIRAARTGFDVTPYFNHEIGLNRTRLAEFPETAAHFLPNGRPLAVGSHFVQTDLCDTLDLIAQRGAAGFYDDLLRRLQRSLRPSCRLPLCRTLPSRWWRAK